MAIICVGCALGHLSNASILLSEARKFETTGNKELAGKHLYAFMSNIRQAEEQHTDKKMRGQIREIRKRVEAAIAANQPIPDVGPEIERKGIKTMQLLRTHPELCPTCSVGAPRIIHE